MSKERRPENTVFGIGISELLEIGEIGELNRCVCLEMDESRNIDRKLIRSI